MSGWTFRTESADGVALPGHIVAPVRFQIQGGGIALLAAPAFTDARLRAIDASSRRR